MDIKKAFEEWIRKDQTEDETNFSLQYGSANESIPLGFYAGAKAALADPNIIDLREVWKELASWVDKLQLRAYGANDYSVGLRTMYRPAPAWTPKVGQAVFCKSNNHTGCYTMVVTKIDLPSIHLTGGLSDWTMLIGDIKPFHPDHIGKSWQDIPAAPKD